MPARGRAAHLLDEAVVAPAAADRVLGRVERLAGELEGGASVVVEAAHQAGREDEGDAERRQAALDRLEVRGGGVGQVVGHHRRAPR